MKGYRYFKASELYSPNSMSYVETCYEQANEGKENGLSHDFDLSEPNTAHHKICQRLRDGKATIGASMGADELVRHYQVYGHLAVDLGLFDDNRVMPVAPKSTGMLTGQLAGAKTQLPSESWHEALKKNYCDQIGFEFMHCDPDQQAWFIERIESKRDLPSEQELRHAYGDLVRAHALESFLGLSFIGQKRFSLEGSEALVPLIEQVLRTHVANGYDDMVLGMAHRGRINALINTLGFKLSDIVAKFDGSFQPTTYSGDVKYHLGHSVNRKIDGKDVHIALGYNPSHLEAINAVVMGNVRARIDRGKSTSFAILVHGDAAIAGQGVVMETMSMSRVPGYEIGGVVHIVVNNQIGFTTNPSDGRSTTYCTDIAKMISAPVMHVPADNLAAVLSAAKIASEYKAKFNQDVFIDLIGYRKYGHNEADEPRATQPKLYHLLDQSPDIVKKVAADLVGMNIPASDLEDIEQKVAKRVEDQDSLIETEQGQQSIRETDWKSYTKTDWRASYTTGIDEEKLKQVAEKVTAYPENFVLQRQVAKLLESRKQMANGDTKINWGMAELMAYQLLIEEGFPVRLVGQDCIRGTFAHRHASLFDQESGEKHCSVQSNGDIGLSNYNSILSEYAALGYEYGYAETNPNTLVMFEAQFGDFINGAQIIIDQFISSGYEKWQRQCGLVMLLPHGYEGQGPEHSSARLERFMQLAAKDCMQVCVPSSAAQIFNLLIRQTRRSYRRPMIVMTPKSLLRLPEAASDMAEMDGIFKTVIDDTKASIKAHTLLLCSGKLYYELVAANTDKMTAIVRLEQLYPFPDAELKAVFKRYKGLKSIKWCQEEPKNQGAWQGIRDNLEAVLPKDVTLKVYARPVCASPAVGYLSVHQAQQAELIQTIFAEDNL